MADPGASDRYAGPRGRAYYEGYQRASGRRGGRLLVPVFAPHLRAGDRLVELGCGGGWLLEALPVAHRMGIEVNPVAADEARARGLDVRTSLTEVEDGSADVVVSNHALEHVLEPFTVLCEIRRVLAPGGRLVLALPLGDWRNERHPRTDDVDGHLYSWTPQNLVNLLTEAGFTDIDSRVVTFAWPPGAERLARVPVAYRLAGGAWSILRRRRQTFTLARRPRA